MPPSADDTAPKPTSSRSFSAPIAVVAIFLMIVLPLLYMLSIGPAVWLESRGHIDAPEDSAIVKFYWPLHWLIERSGPAMTVFDWYVGFWEASPPTA